MSVLSWVLTRPKTVFSLILGGFVTIVGVSANSLDMSDESNDFLFRSVPDSEADRKKPNSGSSNKNGEETLDWSEVMDLKTFEDAPLVQVSYKKLLYGDSTYNGGNYIIYYGSEACTHCTGFLFGDRDLSKGNLWLHRDRMSDGVWMKAFESTKQDEEIKSKNIKFLMYEDVPSQEKINHDNDFWSLPWARWEQDDHLKGRVKGEYKRNDKSAKEFRRVFTAAQERFGDKVSGTPTVILYKEGRPAVYNHTQLPGLITAKQDEDLSEVVAFKKFIKHYYTKTEFKDT